MTDQTYTSKKAAQAAARKEHGKDYAKRYEVQEVELGTNEWIIIEKEPVVTTGKPKKEAVPQPERIEQNGVKRPGPGKCLEVWEWLDENGNCMPKNLRPVAAEKGWNENNAQIELYQWRKFNGIAGRQAKAAK
ncbi:hypothetical protein KZO25_06765 [Halomonas sp. ANAO-440]|uniref:hypothetical protein n=1 Tax=Halomonas sp. ANAO-440 TaxID=2861360 RepID=UPI001CAA72B9|nr:hypothetical protein [Halomonas sp. ANAO-440]MBZ0330020.1 hypothetical protein [Halomonas sp. ANAO-440]